jgi:hypothetical protein
MRSPDPAPRSSYDLLVVGGCAVRIARSTSRGLRSSSLALAMRIAGALRVPRARAPHRVPLPQLRRAADLPAARVELAK